LDVISKFPSIILLEMNRDICQEVTELELGQAINYIYSGKSPGLDGFMVEFFKSFYEFLKDDVLEMVKELFDNTGIPTEDEHLQ
jgi:hypothetical protein